MKYISFILSPVLFTLSLLIPKNRKLWLYGGWFGERYADNSKDFFEYCNKLTPDLGIQHIWIYKNKDIKKTIDRLGYKSMYAYSFNGIIAQLRAKVFITCINSSDFIPFILTPRNFIVQLWHGSPIKHIGIDSRKSGIRKLLDKIRFLLLDRYTIIISPSELTDGIFQSAFLSKKDRIVRTGYPRNSNLALRPEESLHIKKHFGCDTKDKVFAYLPTHRQEGKGQNPFRNVLKEIIKYNHRLKENNVTIIVKPHFYERDSLKDISESSNVLIRYDLPFDLYSFLGASDGLITDYSSVIFDYELLDKEIVVYPFDYDNYTKKDRGLYFEFKYVYDNVKNIQEVNSVEQLVSYLGTSNLKTNNFLEYPTKFNVPYGDYSMHIYKEIITRMRLR